MKKCLMTALMLLSFASIAFCGLDKVPEAEQAAAADFTSGAAVCLSCHQEYKGFISSDMPTKRKENEFIEHTFASVDADFGKKNCSGCHVKSCLGCHTDNKKPAAEACLSCHNDINTGMDYTGLGIREDHERYQRGPEFEGKNYMKMLPDIHFEKGMDCADCHSMASFSDKSLVKECADCHSYSRDVIDHQIAGHDKVACVSCHAAWSPTEYGAFYVRFVNSDKLKGYYWGIPRLGEEYVKSSFMRLNTQFALAKDAEGRYVPIRPRLIFFTSTQDDRVFMPENRLLSNRWEQFTPHTVRRETVLCEACHSEPKRYLLERAEDGYFMLRKDGLALESFWNSKAFRLEDGDFVTEEDYKRISERSKLYVRYYLKKLNELKALVK